MLPPYTRSSSLRWLNRSKSEKGPTGSGTGGMAKADRSLRGRLPRWEARKGGTYFVRSDLTGTPVEGAAAALADESGQPPAAPVSEPAEEPDNSYNVNEVLFSFMSEIDKLGELSRLLGQLRFAVDGSDQTNADEVGEEITVLARHLPEGFRVKDLLDVARDNSDRSSQLAKLYLDRCFRLSAGEEGADQELEDQIQSLRAQD